jgi:hypothetical protein
LIEIQRDEFNKLRFPIGPDSRLKSSERQTTLVCVHYGIRDFGDYILWSTFLIGFPSPDQISLKKNNKL